MIGVADSDSYNASDLGIEPFKIGPISIVGIKRDLTLSGKSIDEYYQHYFSALSQEPVSEEMMTMLKDIKSYTYNGATVLSIKIDNTGKNKFVRESGYRYIDFDEAVSDGIGNWKSGMLSNDGVHPSKAGAKIMADIFLIDFPEIMNYTK